MEKEVNGVTEAMLADKFSPSTNKEMAKKIGIEVSESGVKIPSELFDVFSPKVLGKFIGGLCVMTAGDLLSRTVAKKVVERYPHSEKGIGKVLFIIKHLDVLFKPSWLKLGILAAANISDFKKGFELATNNFGNHLTDEVKRIISGDSVAEEETVKIVITTSKNHSYYGFCSCGKCGVSLDDSVPTKCPNCGCRLSGIEIDQCPFEESIP